MVTSTLAAIQIKVRRLTGSPNQNQLTDTVLNEYINTYVQQDLPYGLKLWDLQEIYTFFTQPYVDTYTFPFNVDLDSAGDPLPAYQGINPPIYIDGYQSFYTQSRDEFFKIYPLLNQQQAAATGDGTTTGFSFTLSNTPVLRNNVSITGIDTAGNTQTVQDDGNGNLVTYSFASPIVPPLPAGTVNYVTGATTVTFPVAIAAAEQITAFFVPYQANRPVAMLFYNNQMTLRPVPDLSYRVVVNAYKNPVQLLSTTQDPEIQQWWQLIALGAARKVLQDRLDNESLASIEPFFQEQMSLVLNKTAFQLAPQRVATIYTDMLNYPVGNRPFGGFN